MCVSFAVIRQPFTLARLYVGAGLRSGEYSFLEPTSMVLLTWRLMPAEVHPRWNREAWESQFYFTSRTLSGNKSLLALDAGSHHPLPTGPCSSVAKFISPAALCLGTRVSGLLTPEATNFCRLALQFHRQIYFASRTLSGSKSLFAFDTGSHQLLPTGLAVPSPDLFRQPHFVW